MISIGKSKNLIRGTRAGICSVGGGTCLTTRKSFSFKNPRPRKVFFVDLGISFSFSVEGLRSKNLLKPEGGILGLARNRKVYIYINLVEVDIFAVRR